VTDEELRELITNYQPNPDVLASMADIKILAVVGPTASGKTTLMEALAKSNPSYKIVLDETSRRPRTGEKHGVDFLFRTREEIVDDAQKGNLVQIALGPNNDLYCTSPQNYPHNGTSLIALVPAAVLEFRELPIKSFKAAFIVPGSYEQWQQWLAKQSRDSQWSDEQLSKRLAEAKENFEFALSDKDMNFVLNNETQSAVDRLLNLANGELLVDEPLAKQTAEGNYHRLLKELGIR